MAISESSRGWYICVCNPFGPMSYSHRCLLTAAGFCFASGLISCSNAGTSKTISTTPPAPVVPPPTITAKAKFVYTGNQGASLSGYAVDPSSGALTPLSGFPFPLGTNPEIIAHDPQNRFLIVTDASTSQLHVLAINSDTGALAEVTTPPYATLKNPYSEVIDPTGSHVYVVSLNNGVVGAFNLNSTGVLTEVVGSPFSTSAPGNGTSLVMNSQGSFLYVQDTANVYVFSVSGGTGALTLQQTLKGPVQGSQLTLDPAENYLYAVGAGSNSILTYSIDASSGLLTAAKASAMVEKNGAYTVTVSPNGRFAYTIENNNDLVSYTITDGAFTPVGKSYSGVYGAQIAVDPSSSFVYVPQACSFCTNGPYNVVHEFSIGSTGELTPLPVSTVAAGVTPWGITVTSQ
jgi:6-phosphogluconolactonase